MWLAALVDARFGAELPAEIAMMLGIVAFVGEHGPDPRAIAYEKSGRWFTGEEPFLRAQERPDAGSSALRHPRSELIAPLPQEVEPAFNNRKLHMRLPWSGSAS